MPAQPFSALATSAINNPNGLFYADSEQTLTNIEAHDFAVQFSMNLRLRGVRAGETVAVDLPLGMQGLFIEACFHLGAVSATVSPRSAPDGVVWDWWVSATNHEIVPATNRITIDNLFLVESAGLSTTAAPAGFESGASLCRIALTSGTTGRPKAIALTVDAVMHRSGEAARLFHGSAPFLSILGLGTTSGFHTLVASTLADIPYLASGTAAHNVALIRRFGVSAIKASPVQISELTAATRDAGVRLDSLEFVYSAGGAISNELAGAIAAVSNAQLVNLYGSSEAGRAAEYPVTGFVEPELAGVVVAQSTVEIVDGSGDALPVGATGTVRYRAPYMTTEYVGDPAASSTAFIDGWFYPGDLGHLTESGELFLAGRTVDTLNAGGLKLDPSAIEECARGFLGVTDALGFTHRGPNGIDQFILAVAGESIDAAGLAHHLESEFGARRPSGIFTVPQIPQTETGKVSRFLTAQLYADAIARATN